MKTLKYFAAAAACVGVCAGGGAWADTITHFTAKGTLADKAKVTGEAWVDVNTGVMTSADFQLSSPDKFNETAIINQGVNEFGSGTYGVDVGNSSAMELDMVFPNFDLVDFKGATVTTGHLYNLVTGIVGSSIVSLKFSPDSIKNFYAYGDMQDGSAIGGYLTVDRTLGTITHSNLKIGGPDYLAQVQVASQGLGLYQAGQYGANIENVSDSSDLLFNLGTASLVNWNGGPAVAGELLINGNQHLLTSLSFSTTVNPILARAVPEPGAWGLMLVGFGLAGAALRRRAGETA